MRSRGRAGKSLKAKNVWRMCQARMQSKNPFKKPLTRMQKDYEMYVTNQYNVCRLIWPGVTE